MNNYDRNQATFENHKYDAVRVRDQTFLVNTKEQEVYKILGDKIYQNRPNLKITVRKVIKRDVIDEVLQYAVKNNDSTTVDIDCEEFGKDNIETLLYADD